MSLGGAYGRGGVTWIKVEHLNELFYWFPGCDIQRHMRCTSVIRLMWRI